MLSQLDVDIRYWLSERGAVVLRCPDNSLERLLSLQEVLGASASHELRTRDNVYEIRYEDSHTFHIGRNNAAQTPHTDSPFRVEPPSIVALQCVVPSPDEGVIIIVPGDEVYRDLRDNCPDALAALRNADAVVSKRGEFVRHMSVFRDLRGRVALSYRRDSFAMMEAKGLAQVGLDRIQQFVEHPSNHIRFGLCAGDIIIVDNTRILHGRTAFPADAGRLLRRLWCDGQRPGLHLGIPIHENVWEGTSAANVPLLRVEEC